jgi:hypothetical protein
MEENKKDGERREGAGKGDDLGDKSEKCKLGRDDDGDGNKRGRKIGGIVTGGG